MADGRNVSQAMAVTPDGNSTFGIARDGVDPTYGEDLFALTRWDASGNPTSLSSPEPIGFGTWKVAAVSANGNTVVGCTNGGQPFIWTATGGYGGFPSVMEISDLDPISLSGDGDFAVGNLGNPAVDGNITLDPVVLIGGTSVGEPLSTYLTDEGVNLTGFTLDTVDGMSRDGSILSGTGHYASDSTRTEYVWMSDVPEPGSFALLGLSLLILTGKHRPPRLRL